MVVALNVPRRARERAEDDGVSTLKVKRQCSLLFSVSWKKKKRD